MRSQAIDGDTAHEVHSRDEFTCQTCSAVGGPRGSAQLQVSQLVPADAGGSRHEVNLLTLCDGCHTLLQSDRPADSVSPYIARYRELVDRVAVGQGAAEGYVACCRELLGSDEGWTSYRAARRELTEQCDRIEAAIEAVRSLPPFERPVSTGLRDAHERCLDRWERWVDVTRTLVDRVDTLVRADRSNSYRCPDCGAGVWLDDEFCRGCGESFDPEAALEAEVRDLRRSLIEFATTLDD